MHANVRVRARGKPLRVSIVSMKIIKLLEELFFTKHKRTLIQP